MSQACAFRSPFVGDFKCYRDFTPTMGLIASSTNPVSELGPLYYDIDAVGSLAGERNALLKVTAAILGGIRGSILPVGAAHFCLDEPGISQLFLTPVFSEQNNPFSPSYRKPLTRRKLSKAARNALRSVQTFKNEEFLCLRDR
jgi:hypothetical protein